MFLIPNLYFLIRIYSVSIPLLYYTYNSSFLVSMVNLVRLKETFSVFVSHFYPVLAGYKCFWCLHNLSFKIGFTKSAHLSYNTFCKTGYKFPYIKCSCYMKFCWVKKTNPVNFLDPWKVFITFLLYVILGKENIMVQVSAASWIQKLPTRKRKN